MAYLYKLSSPWKANLGSNTINATNKDLPALIDTISRNSRLQKRYFCSRQLFLSENIKSIFKVNQIWQLLPKSFLRIINEYELMHAFTVSRGILVGRDLAMFWTAVLALHSFMPFHPKTNFHTGPYIRITWKLVNFMHGTKTWHCNKVKCVNAL